MTMEILPGPNLTVATPTALDSSNRPASTEFVTNAIVAAIATAVASLGPIVSTTQIDFLSGGIAQPNVQEYRIVEFVYFPMTLSTIAAKLSTGSITSYLKINSSTVTGSILSALGTTQITSVLTAINTATTGDVLVFGVSATASSPANLSFSVKFTRSLS